MKNRKLLALIVFALLISTCQKEKSPATSNTPPVSVLEVTSSLTAAQDKFIEFGKQPGTTPQVALGLTAEWLKTQPNVSSVNVEGNTVINFKLKSGIPGIFFLDIMDQNGFSISRGGDSGGASLKLMSTKQSKNKIENKKVLLCYPNAGDFYTDQELNNTLDRFKSSDLGLEVSEELLSKVSPDLVSTFGDYGLVILNTHGTKDCFLSGSSINLDLTNSSTDEILKNTIITEFSQKTYDDLTSGLLRIGVHIRATSGPDWVKDYTKSNKNFTIWIGSEYIKSLPDMPNTIILGNFCYSGETRSSNEYPNPIGTAFRNLKLISYYCYDDGNGGSDNVDNGFAKAMADSLTKSFVIEDDSTGNAYLSHMGVEFKDPYNSGYLKQYGAKDYSYKYKTADPGMVAVTGGTFQMGNAFDVLDKVGRPIHTVSVSSFLIDKFEITYEKWTQVRNWALANGYASTDIAEGQDGVSASGPATTGANNPVTRVNWYDILKWCNARSEMDGLKPVYYTTNKQDIVYRAGQIINYPSNAVNWTANGYRLPTEAEWEFAARGGTKSGNFKYSGSNTIGDVAWYAGNSGSSPLVDLTTHPVGQKTPNELGICDMSGNALEWCWDLRGDYTSAAQTNPRGAVGGGTNVLRGGGYNMDPGLCESADRQMQYNPTIRTFAGFRCAAN